MQYQQKECDKYISEQSLNWLIYQWGCVCRPELEKQELIEEYRELKDAINSD